MEEAWLGDQMEPEMAEQLRNANLAWVRSHDITSVETNLITLWLANRNTWRETGGDASF
jgi:hypothetical protein